MPRNSEAARESEGTPAGAETTPPAARARRKSARQASAAEQEQGSTPAETAASSAAPEAKAEEQTPAEEHPAAPPPLTGLRGADYVKALAAHASTTIQVPLLPNERRGDWERAKGQKVPVTARQFNHQQETGSSILVEREHALAALVVELQRPGASRFDQIDLHGSLTRAAIDRLSDYMNQARLHAQAQTGKKWNATHIYLIPIEDA